MMHTNDRQAKDIPLSVGMGTPKGDGFGKIELSWESERTNLWPAKSILKPRKAKRESVRELRTGRPLWTGCSNWWMKGT